MADSFDIVQTAMSTSTGTQTITGSLGGATPKAAILIINYNTNEDTVEGFDAADPACAGQVVSVTDGTTHFCTFWRATDNVAPNATNHARSGMVTNGTAASVGNEQFISMLDPATAFRDIEASGPALAANELSFTIDAVDATLPVAYKATCIFLYGDMECEVQCETMPGAVNGSSSFTFTNISGEADTLLAFCGSAAAGTRNGVNNVLWTGGFANKNLEQASYCVAIRQGVATSEASGYLSDAYCAGFLNAVTGAFNNGFEATGFDTNSGNARITLTNRINGGSNDLGMLAIKWGSLVPDIVVDDTDTDALPHTQSIATTNGDHTFSLILGSSLSAKNTAQTGSTAIAGCIGVANTSEDDVFGFSYEDGTGTTVSKTYRNTIGYAVPATTGSFPTGSAHQASVTLGGTVDLAYSVTDLTTPRFFALLALGSTDPLAVEDETVDVTEGTVAIIGKVSVVNEVLDVSETVVSIIINETFETEQRGELNQGKNFRGEITQSSPTGEIQ